MVRAVDQTVLLQFPQQISMNELAEQCGVTPAYLSRCCKMQMGCGWSERLRAVRLRAARTFMACGASNIQWISENVGYEDPKYFARIFRSEYAQSPTAYLRERNGPVQECTSNADDYNIYIGKTGQIYADYGLFHEISGVITHVGAYSRRVGFREGDRVAASPFLPCGACPLCRAGKLNLCLERSGSGRLADYIRVNQKQLFRIPTEISMEEGALSWLASTCVRCIEQLEVRPGQSVLILGGGSAGQILTQLAKKRMTSVLSVSDPVQSKRLLAIENGADHVIDSTNENIMRRGLELTNGLGFDVIIDAAGSFLALQNGIDLLGRGGKLMIFASYDISVQLQINLADLYWKECSILTLYGATSAPYTGTEASILKQLSLGPLIGKKYPLEQVSSALEAYGTGLYTRILVCMS